MKRELPTAAKWNWRASIARGDEVFFRSRPSSFLGSNFFFSRSIGPHQVCNGGFSIWVYYFGPDLHSGMEATIDIISLLLALSRVHFFYENVLFKETRFCYILHYSVKLNHVFIELSGVNIYIYIYIYIFVKKNVFWWFQEQWICWERLYRERTYLVTLALIFFLIFYFIFLSY